MRDLDVAIELAPQDADAREARGITHLDRQEFDEAIVDFTEAIRLNPKKTKIFAYRLRTAPRG